MKNNTLATDVIRSVKSRARFWFAAFIITLAAAIIGRIAERR